MDLARAVMKGCWRVKRLPHGSYEGLLEVFIADWMAVMKGCWRRNQNPAGSYEGLLEELTTVKWQL